MSDYRELIKELNRVDALFEYESLGIPELIHVKARATGRGICSISKKVAQRRLDKGWAEHSSEYSYSPTMRLALGLPEVTETW